MGIVQDRQILVCNVIQTFDLIFFFQSQLQRGTMNPELAIVIWILRYLNSPCLHRMSFIENEISDDY